MAGLDPAICLRFHLVDRLAQSHRETSRTFSERLAPAALQMSNSTLTLRLCLGRLVDDFDPSVLRGEHVAFVLRSPLSIADGLEVCGR